MPRIDDFTLANAVSYVPRKPQHHEAPEWVGSDADYYITVCAEPRGTNHFCFPTMGNVILDSIKFRNEKRIWFCSLAVLMPDHIHLIINFGDAPRIARVLGDWKHWLAHQHGISWQRNFFEHRLRNEESDRNKGEYIFQNPVRAGLVEKAEDWPYVWVALG